MMGRYRYDVLVCGSDLVDPGAHDHGCVFTLMASFWDYRYPEAWDVACEYAHAKVMCGINTDEAIHRSFEHIAGGGLCEQCGRRRGPLVRFPQGHRFMCEPCCRGWVSWDWNWTKQHGMYPTDYWYRPLSQARPWSGPDIEHFRGDHELTMIEFRDDKPDEQGRRSFVAYWLADNLGEHLDQHGVRGQNYCAVPAVFAHRCHDRGHTVLVWDGRTPQPLASTLHDSEPT
ncbi:hypothetical protein ACW9HR_37125 [Nocardia gipuzkoensis]